MDEHHDLRHELDDLSMAYARLQAERGALKAAALTLQRVQFIIGGISGTSTDNDEEALRINAECALALMREKLPPIVATLTHTSPADLTRAIVEACERDPRPFVEVYAELVQDGLWKPVWDALGVGERARVVEDARKEAGRE